MKKTILYLLFEQIIVVLTLVVHLCGFMSVSPVTVKNDQRSMTAFESFIENSGKYSFKESEVSKVVLLIIDALRADHLVTANEPLMKYSTQLINKNQALGYLLKTAAPTVTLPRIKAVVTGSIPSFMDVIFNFASTELKEENVIDFMTKMGLKIKLYGDNTWLRLFPNTFHHWDVVTSFFVSDYTEVDNNVTRHLSKAFSKNDPFDVLILHYLGLDHIGHLEGPQSQLIGPKLKEMDDIIRNIHTHLKNTNKPYFFLVCGDHGMSDAGGHGGTSHSEIWTSGLVITHFTDKNEASKFKSSFQIHGDQIRNQVDIASTLALLMGTEIPSKNVGRPFMEIIRSFPLNKQLSAHYRLAKQLVTLSTLTQPSSLTLTKITDLYKNATKLHKEFWIRNEAEDAAPNPPNKTQLKRLLNLYEECEILSSSTLMDNMQSYNLILLVASSCILAVITFSSISSTIFLASETSTPYQALKKLSLISGFGLVINSGFSYSDIPTIPFSYYMTVVSLVYGIIHLRTIIKYLPRCSFSMSGKSYLDIGILFGVILHPLSLLATSLVEEEHFGFYFIISLVHFLLCALLVFNLLKSKSYGKFIYRYATNDEEREADSVYRCTSPINSMKLVQYPALFNTHSCFLSFFNCITEKLGVHWMDFKALSMKQLPHLISVYLSWWLFRFMRTFNSTGDKWKHLADLNDLIRNSEKPVLIMCTFSGLLITCCLYQSYGRVFVLLSLIGIFGRHFPIIDLGLKSGTYEALFSYIAVTSLLAFGIFKISRYVYLFRSSKRKDGELTHINIAVYFLQYLEAFIAITFLLLQRHENILLSSLLFLHYHLIFPVLVRNSSILRMSKTSVYIFAFWVAQGHFFIQGNSNNLSTVDINSGFVGISSYLPILHGILIILHTFGSKILFLIHFIVVLLCHEKSFKRVEECLWTWWSMQLLTITVYVINVTLQRYHLFIWSVFAPKLLYEESHLLCLLIVTVVTFISFKIGHAFGYR